MPARTSSNLQANCPELALWFTISPYFKDLGQARPTAPIEAVYFCTKVEIENLGPVGLTIRNIEIHRHSEAFARYCHPPEGLETRGGLVGNVGGRAVKLPKRLEALDAYVGELWCQGPRLDFQDQPEPEWTVKIDAVGGTSVECLPTKVVCAPKCRPR